MRGGGGKLRYFMERKSEQRCAPFWILFLLRKYCVRQSILSPRRVIMLYCTSLTLYYLSMRWHGEGLDAVTVWACAGLVPILKGLTSICRVI